MKKEWENKRCRGELVQLAYIRPIKTKDNFRVALCHIGRFLNRVQVENFVSSKLDVNKFIPSKFATWKFST
jgi:hypothetical protein